MDIRNRDDKPISWYLSPGQSWAPASRSHSQVTEASDYKEWISQAAVCNRRPNTYHEDWKVPKQRLSVTKRFLNENVPPWLPRQKRSRATCLYLDQLNRTGPLQIKRFEPPIGASNDVYQLHREVELDKLTTEIQEVPYAGRRRLFLLESTDPGFVQVMAFCLGIDPCVFASHERTALWEFRHRAGNVRPLASTRNTLLGFTMEFSELRQFFTRSPGDDVAGNVLPFNQVFSNLSARNPVDHRHLGITKVKSQIQDVGLLHQKATYWAKEYKPVADAWDALIIVDPALPEESSVARALEVPDLDDGVQRIDRRQKSWPGRYEHILIGDSSTCYETEVYGEPYQGGYRDFLPLEAYDATGQLQMCTGPRRVSLYDDLIYYWTKHSGQASISSKPISATFFLQKIVASHYELLIDYLRGALCETEYVTQFAHSQFKAAQIESQWSDMQSWATRCREYSDFVDDILESRTALTEDFARDVPQDVHLQHWKECCKDFESISRRLHHIRERCDLLVTSYNALAGMVGNRQAITEAKRVTILTILAMIFLPLSFSVGLFGTNPPWAPGSPEAWKLYVSMGATTGGVVFLALVAHYGFADEGQWWLSRVLVNLRLWLGVFACPPLFVYIFVEGWRDVFKPKRQLRSFV